MLHVRYYETVDGRSPYADWFASLDPVARARVSVAIVRIGHGNLSNVKPVGEGVLEYKINFGPGYRLYFGRDGDELVILLVGGTKRRQRRISKTPCDSGEHIRMPNGPTEDGGHQCRPEASRI
jgi:putative addiction module killer protein